MTPDSFGALMCVAIRDLINEGRPATLACVFLRMGLLDTEVRESAIFADALLACQRLVKAALHK
jgi:hypothetical protein